MSDHLRFHPKRSTSESRLLGMAIRRAIRCGLIDSCVETHRHMAQIARGSDLWVVPWEGIPSLLDQLARRGNCSGAFLDSMEDLANAVPWWEATP